MKSVKEYFNSRVAGIEYAIWIMLILLALSFFCCRIKPPHDCPDKFKRGDRVRVLINGEEGIVNGFYRHGKCRVRLKDLKEYGFDAAELEHINKIKTF